VKALDKSRQSETEVVQYGLIARWERAAAIDSFIQAVGGGTRDGCGNFRPRKVKETFHSIR
jgi:hypothetical protein